MSWKTTWLIVAGVIATSAIVAVVSNSIKTPANAGPPSVYVYGTDAINLDYAITAVKDGSIYDHQPGYTASDTPANGGEMGGSSSTPMVAIPIPGDYFGGPKNPPIGQFHAGDSFCADLPGSGGAGAGGPTKADPITLYDTNSVGEYYLTQNGTTRKGFAPDNGDFISSKTIETCAKLAQMMPLSQVAAGTGTIYISPAVQQTIGVIAAILIFGGIALWHIFSGIAAEKPESRARLWNEHKSGYSFNEYTGEWQRITGRNPGTQSIIVDTRSRGERIIAERRAAGGRLAAALAANAWGFLLALGAVYLPGNPDAVDTPGGVMVVVFGLPVVGWMVFRQIQYNTGHGGFLVIDPRREEITQNPFGPGNTVSPVDHPAADDLAY